MCPRLGLLSGKAVQFSITNVLLLLRLEAEAPVPKCWEEPNGSVTKTQRHGPCDMAPQPPSVLYAMFSHLLLAFPFPKGHRHR